MQFCNFIINLLFILQTISSIVYTVGLYMEKVTEWLLNSKF